MDELELRRMVYGYIKEICHYSQMQVFATSFYQKNYFQLQIDETINRLINFFLEMNLALTNKILREQQELQGQQGQQNQQEQQNQQGQQEQQEQPVEQEQEQILDNNVVRHFTIEELANYNGLEGREAYVAVNGKVYDVSTMVRWAGGTHFGLKAGQDLSRQFMGCHQGIMDRLLALPQVGVLGEIGGNQVI